MDKRASKSEKTIQQLVNLQCIAFELSWMEKQLLQNVKSVYNPQNIFHLEKQWHVNTTGLCSGGCTVVYRLMMNNITNSCEINKAISQGWEDAKALVMRNKCAYGVCFWGFVF